MDGGNSIKNFPHTDRAILNLIPYQIFEPKNVHIFNFLNFQDFDARSSFLN